MELLHNRYEIIKRLSDTTVCEVYLCKDNTNDTSVSVYKVKSSFMQDVSFVNGLTQGIIDCRDLNHANTLKFIDVDTDPDNESIIYVYEYADGVSLKEVFARQAKLPLQKSIEIAVNVLQSLDNAHLMGICHGDLYTDDVFITQDGHVKVRGFGRKDGIEQSSIAKEHLSLETIRYQSPEVLENQGLYESSDVYSVGVILYQMLTGRLPFDGNTSVEIATKILRDAPLSPRMINRDLSASLSSLILESINKEYNARVGTASLFISRLTDALRGYKQGEYSAPKEHIAIKQETGKDKKSVIPMLLVLFVVACVLTAAITVVAINGKKMQTPNLIGLTEEEAINKLQGLKLGFNKGEDRFSTDYGAGVICDQSPKAGEKIGKKEKVEYYLSKGAPEIKMPYIIGLDYETAKEKLSMGNFTIELKEEFSNSVPDGSVISTSPETGVTLSNGAPITITISKGSGGGSYTSSGTTSGRINYGNSETGAPTYTGDNPEGNDSEDRPRRSSKQGKKVSSQGSDTPTETTTSKKTDEGKTSTKKEEAKVDTPKPQPKETSKPSESHSSYSSSGGSTPDATVDFE
ncbi:MAG: PASTA domain-containing protein [Abditibacteriota bacterium]|nr:PASTA domain-containing protein [Abditibacteriota bacterium]